MVSAFSACSIASKACHKLRSCLTCCCLCWCLWNLPLVLQLFFLPLEPSLFMRAYTYMTWSRVQHNGLLKSCGFLPAVISSMARDGAWVVFSVLPVGGKVLGRSGNLQWINTWCVHGVTERSLASARMRSFWRSKDFKAKARSIWQSVTRVSLAGFKPSESSLKLGTLVKVCCNLQRSKGTGSSGEVMARCSPLNAEWWGPFQGLVHEHAAGERKRRN